MATNLADAGAHFMIYTRDGEGIIFDGSYPQFEDCFFSFSEGSSKKSQILRWAKEEGFTVVFPTEQK
jgi:hypothetical protein